ncbi:MAG: BREX system P-loop protein BrxC, partial [Polyangiaceae bacterium]
KPWGKLKDSPLAEDYFSAAIYETHKDLYASPTGWVDSRTGSRFHGKHSADEAVQAIEQMIAHRAPGRTLFLVIDEVSQYVHDDEDRMLALQSFVAALGQRMRGRAWLLATGQQKLEEGAGVTSPIVKLKGRFPPSLRVHLGGANIRTVVYQRLLRKKRLLEADLRELFEQHRPDLALYAYQGEQIGEADFVEVYPLLPGHIDLLLRITSGLRARGSRVQGDAHEIRGLLQLLGDIFRDQDLARREPGWLLTIDRVYDVLHTALEPDLHMTLNRAMDYCQQQGSDLMKRIVKAVAMLELIQDDKHPTTADLVARCLYAKLGDGTHLADVQKALDALVGEGLLGHSVSTGYKIESSAGQDWQRTRDAYVPVGEQISEKVQATLRDLLADVDKVTVKGLPLSWLVLFTDNLGTKEAHLKDDKKPTVLTLDLQLTKGEGRDDWIPRSETPTYVHRMVWVVGEQDDLRHAAIQVVRSERMIEIHAGAGSTEQQRLVIDERNKLDAATRDLATAVKAAFMAGAVYFRSHPYAPRDHGSAFLTALAALGNRVGESLYPNPAAYSVGEKDIVYLLESSDLSAPPPVFGQDKLGIVSLDVGRYEVTCSGPVPKEILAFVKEHGGVTGATLLTHFGGPPHGVPPDVVRAAVVGLLRGGKLRIELAGVGEITSVRDEGARELLKEGGLRKAKLTENAVETLSPRDKNVICGLFKEQLGKEVARDNDAIADAVAERFALVRARLDQLGVLFHRLPKGTKYPAQLDKLRSALEACRRDRRVEPTVMAVKRSLPALRDGLTLLRRMETDLTSEAADALDEAEGVRDRLGPSLLASGASDDARAALTAIDAHLRTDQPWGDAGQLAPLVATVRTEYRDRRRAILDAHAKAVEVARERIKRKDGFDRLDPDQRHAVLRHLTEGTAPGTDEKAIAPALEALEGQLAARREAAETKALQHFDELRVTLGAAPVVEIDLGLGGREIESEADLDRLLADLRARIVHELAARHRVRLRNS